jgi:hypothetical protein
MWRGRLQQSVDLHLVNCDAAVRADIAARSTPDAFIGIGCVSIMVTLVVYLFRLERQDVGRARDYAKVTPFASLGIDDNSTSDFRHNDYLF